MLKLKRTVLPAGKPEGEDWVLSSGLTPQQLLRVSRAICLTEDDEVFGAPCSDCDHLINPRNEAAALSLLLAQLEDTPTSHSINVGLQEAWQAYSALASTHCSDAAGSESIVQPDDNETPEGELLRWCKEKGGTSRVAPAVFPGGLRGAAAVEAVEAGSIVISIPADMLITAATAAHSDLGAALSRIPGLDEDSLALIWTMADRHDPESPHTPFWRALPSAFGTGLTAAEEDIQLLQGTQLHAEAATARQHVRAAYEQLEPVLEALVRAYPQYLQAEHFTLEAYLWAVELWYAYAIQVQFPDGRISSALVPLVSLLNHSPYPHVVHFSRVDPASKHLRLRTFRKVCPGEQCFLSYGPLPSSHLLLFYGFVPASNPFDTVTLQLPLKADQHRGSRLKALDAHGLQLQQRVACRPHLPRPLFAALRVLEAGQKLLKRLSAGSADPWEKLTDENEAAAMQLLRLLLEEQLESLKQSPAAQHVTPECQGTSEDAGSTAVALPRSLAEASKSGQGRSAPERGSDGIAAASELGHNTELCGPVGSGGTVGGVVAAGAGGATASQREGDSAAGDLAHGSADDVAAGGVMGGPVKRDQASAMFRRHALEYVRSQLRVLESALRCCPPRGEVG